MSYRQYLTTTQVSSALGVSVNTVKRWVDLGVLTAHRTAGGHRKLLIADVLRVVREGSLPLVDLSALQVAETRTRIEAPETLAALFQDALEKRDRSAAASLIEGAYRAGMGVGEIADRIVAPALDAIGHGWEDGRLGIHHEHHATQLCADVLHELKADVDANRSSGGPLAIGAAPEGDPYFVACLLAELVLLDAGFEVINLGPNTPLASLQQAMEEFNPCLVWLSVSATPDFNVFEREYGRLYRQAERLGVSVVLGGRALTEERRRSLPHTTYGDGLTHLAAFVNATHPRRRRPARGRPVTRR